MLERTFKQGYSVDGKYAAYWAEPEYSRDLWDVTFQVEGVGADLQDTRAFRLDYVREANSTPVPRKDLLHGVFMILGKTVSADVVVLSLNKLLDHIVTNGLFIGERNGKRMFEKVKPSDGSKAITKFKKVSFGFTGTYVGYAISPDQIEYGFCKVASLMFSGQGEDDPFQTEPVLKPDTMYSDVVVLISPALWLALGWGYLLLLAQPRCRGTRIRDTCAGLGVGVLTVER